MLRIPADFVKMSCVIALVSAPGLLVADEYTQINLVSDIPGLANTTDPNLLDPWGVSFAATSPFWVSNQASGTSTLYNGAGSKIPLTVSVPNLGDAPGGINNGPTGQVFNIGGSTNFLLAGAGSGANFIFANLDGSISAWNGGAGTTAVIKANVPGASFTGLAIATVNGSPQIYAADQNGSGIDVFNSSWQQIGQFTDPNVPAGYTPFNVQAIGSVLYVTFTNQSLTSAGNGIVDEFNTNGTFIKRVATGGALDMPWGVTIAPAGFGAFSNDLLIGNNGNGEILAYDPNNPNAFLGTLDGINGLPIVDDNLWALDTRTTGPNVNSDALYFAAGINSGADGLFGELVLATPEPSTIFETAAALLLMVLFRIRRSRLSA
ncbi:MAG: TIGR03118 family protein [Bryobacteraceae bacterium]|jgi:uncharacterized protein (TIGR03118 family)